ncbi:hypothetical protein MHYP_G00002540 [Metynnis hypsauchen]
MNVFLLLLLTMGLFGVIGVLLFRSSVPSFFGDLPAALFTLFICATKDGWLEALSHFKTGDPACMYGAMVYFIAFICVGAFVFTNFIIAVIIAHSEIATEEYELSSMRNQRECLKLHQELERIFEEVRNLPINRKQEEEVMVQSQMAASVEGNLLSSKIASGRTGDVLSTFIALEKAHIIDSSAATPQIYSKGHVWEGVRRVSVAAAEARRMSVT